MPAPGNNLLFPGDTAKFPTAADSDPWAPSGEEVKERGGPLTFSSSDTRSSKSAILAALAQPGGPARGRPGRKLSGGITEGAVGRTRPEAPAKGAPCQFRAGMTA